jgi:hypothetical protein
MLFHFPLDALWCGNSALRNNFDHLLRSIVHHELVRDLTANDHDRKGDTAKEMREYIDGVVKIIDIIVRFRRRATAIVVSSCSVITFVITLRHHARHHA